MPSEIRPGKDVQVSDKKQLKVANSADTYRMTIDLNVLEHLGTNLFSNIAAILTESVANAWDADARNVDIVVDQARDRIVIVDDGVGMTSNEMNEKFLRMGYRRREEDLATGRRTSMGRQVMGRKGLGKLSLFSIAEVIEVHSARDGQINGFRMSVDGIRRAVERNDECYMPEPLPKEEIAVKKGKKILLRKIMKRRLKASSSALRMRLARRFSVIGKKFDFGIKINGKAVTIDDRGDLKAAQLLWTFGDFKPDPSSTPKLRKQQVISSRDDDWPKHWKVGGWIGTATSPKELDSGDMGNLNGIVVVARGRLIHENILDKFNDGRLYTKYLTGQIEANFLDQDNEPDIATSDRQGLQEDDDRYVKLLSFLKSRLGIVEQHWTKWRGEHQVKRAKEQSLGSSQWFESLLSGPRKSADEQIASLSSLPMDKESDRKILCRHGLLAIERMQFRRLTTEIAKGVQDPSTLFKLLADSDALEAQFYHEIIRSRLEVIKNFQRIVDKIKPERELHTFLFDHLWLLDPAWERATGSELTESRLLDEGVITDDLSEKERLGRVGIKYTTHAGKHIIVELKHAERKMKLMELVEQGFEYVDKLKKILRSQNQASPDIEVVFVLGKPVDEEKSNPSRLKASMTAISPGSRIVHYDALIQSAHNAYAEYLENCPRLDRVERILEQL